MTRLSIAFFLLTTLATAARSDSCEITTNRLACDGATDDTAALQAALAACDELVLPAGKTCISYPLTLSSHQTLTIPARTVLKAGASTRWPNASASHALPFLSAPKGTTNLTIRGAGTIDGAGEQWYGHNSSARPHMLTLPNATHVLLEDFLMLNSPDFHAELHGSHYRIFGVRIRSPPFDIAPNTDGIDIQGVDFHIRGVDVENGDDSICVKSQVDTDRVVAADVEVDARRAC